MVWCGKAVRTIYEFLLELYPWSSAYPSIIPGIALCSNTLPFGSLDLSSRVEWKYPEA